MADEEIRTIMAPLADGHLLLPSSAVAEVLSFTQPEPLKRVPSWLLGELAWHGWQVPIICFEQLVNKSNSHIITRKARILMVKTLGESTQVNYIGLLIQGLPKLRKVTVDSLVEEQTDQLPDGLFSKVRVDDLQGMIPELGKLTRIVEETAYGS